MIRMFLWFAVITVLVAGVITMVRSMTSMEKWSMVKTLGFGAMCSVIAVSILTAIVVLF